jgi:hypothetical protein
MSTFTSTACYELAKHNIVFSQVGVEVFNKAGTKVDGATFSAGFAIKVVSGDFCFGTIAPSTTFTVDISLSDPDGGFKLIKRPTPKIVGSDELDDPGITHHNWEIADCPISFNLNGTEVTVECPCTTSGSNCTNSCYTKI